MEANSSSLGKSRHLETAGTPLVRLKAYVVQIESEDVPAVVES